MKYIKTYEDIYSDIEYWKIDTNPIEDIKYALLKAGVDPKHAIINSIIMDPYLDKDKDYFYLVKYLDENKKVNWLYLFDDLFNQYNYNGEIKVTDMDKKMIDYNL